MTARLPAHIEVAGLIRAAESVGGFAVVVAKGERDAGSILLLTLEKGEHAQLWERLPSLDGRRQFSAIPPETHKNTAGLHDYLQRRTARDPDIWIVELDVPNPERLVAQFTG